jgi:hypothetical protein
MTTRHQSLAETCRITDAIEARRVNNATQNGNELDMAGWDGVIYVLTVGNTDTTVAFKVQGTNTSGTGYADVPGAAATTLTGTDDNKHVAIDLWRPANRYLRPVVTVGSGTTGADFAVVAIQYRGTGRQPVSPQPLDQLVKVAQG